MGLFDGLLGGGGAGSADDPYADILTPAQRNQMQVQGLLAMAGAFAQAGMPSRLPVPFGSALGSAAAALGTGSEAGMKTAIENALAAQKVRDLRAKAGILAKLNPLFQQALDEADKPVPAPLPPGPGVSLGPPGAGVRPGASPAAPAGSPLMMDRSLLYPDTGGGLLGSDVGAVGEYGAGQPATGLLGPGPAATAAPAASQAALSQDAAAAEVARLDAAYAASNPNASPAAKASMHAENIIRVNPPERGGSSTAPAEPDPGAGGDGWGPTFAQQTAARVRGSPTPEMTDAIVKAAADNNLPPQIMHGLLGVESNFNPNAVSPTGAKGVAQFISSTARSMKLDDPFDPQKAIPKSAEYLAQLRDQYGGDLNKALMAYNAGSNQSKWNPGYAAAVNQRAGEFVPPDGSGGGEDAGWGPTFAQGGPDRVIPSGAGNNLPITRAQYAPGGAAVPGMPQLAPPSSLPGLAAPSTLPPLAAPGAAPALGAGGKIPGLNMTPQKLAIIDAMAEAAGLGNPFKGLLDTYYKSPGYLQESAGAQERGRIAESEPSQLRIQAAKAKADLLQQLAKDGLTLDKDNNPVEIPGMQKLLGQSAGEVEAAKQRAASQFQTVDARVVGPDGQPTTEKMTQYEFTYRRQQQAANASMGAAPKPGDIVGTPALSPAETRSQELGASAGWEALKSTHEAELEAIKSDKKLGQLAQAMQGFTPGATADLRIRSQALLKDLGFIQGTEVPSAETFQRITRQMQIDAAAARTKGSTSNYERDLIAEGTIQRGNTPESIADAIRMTQRLNAYDRSVAAIHRDAINPQTGVPNVVEAQRRIAALGPPLEPGEVSALEQIRAGQVPGKGQTATAPAPPDQHPLMRQQAADAIAKGAPRAGVIKRLQDMGVNTEGL